MGTEGGLVTSIFVLLLFGWLGFLLHVDPRFAGSGVGALFGISGAVLMLGSLAYAFIKRIPAAKERIGKLVNSRLLLSLHVYLGIVGALLAIVHTGHKYDSSLGIALTAAMLLMVLTGFATRYLLPFANAEIKDKLLLLQTARGDLDSAWGALETASLRPAGHVTALAEGVADLEYSVRTHELMKRWFARALTAHIALSISFYLLLVVHVGAGIYFGLRWLR